MAVVQHDYEKLGLHRWGNDKVAKLCRLFNCTVGDLCALCGEFDLGRIRRYIKQNRWPMTLVLQWYKLERFRVGARSPDTQEAFAAQILTWKDAQPSHIKD